MTAALKDLIREYPHMKHIALYGHPQIISADSAILEFGEREHMYNDQVFLFYLLNLVTFRRWDFQPGAVLA